MVWGELTEKMLNALAFVDVNFLMTAYQLLLALIKSALSIGRVQKLG